MSAGAALRRAPAPAPAPSVTVPAAAPRRPRPRLLSEENVRPRHGAARDAILAASDAPGTGARRANGVGASPASDAVDAKSALTARGAMGAVVKPRATPGSRGVMPEFSKILRRARDGEAAALSHLYARFHGTLERAASHGLGARLHRQFDTADIVQSVFADLLRDLPRIEDRGEAAFRGWLQTAVLNKVRMKARRQTLRCGLRRETRLSTDAGSELAARAPGPDTLAAERDEVAHLSRLLGSLPPEQREVICLRVDEGLSWSDVARALDLPTADAARVRYVRALCSLRGRY